VDPPGILESVDGNEEAAAVEENEQLSQELHVACPDNKY
jgi:hypothetical protein